MGRKNTVGKGEIARHEQFLLFPQCFQKACFPGASKGVIMWEWINTIPTFDDLMGKGFLQTICSLIFSQFSSQRFSPQNCLKVRIVWYGIRQTHIIVKLHCSLKFLSFILQVDTLPSRQEIEGKFKIGL